MFTWQSIHRHLCSLVLCDIYHIAGLWDTTCESQLVSWNSSNFRLIAQLKEMALHWEGRWHSVVVSKTQVSCLRTAYIMLPASEWWLPWRPLPAPGAFFLPQFSVSGSKQVCDKPLSFCLVWHAGLFKTAINFSKDDVAANYRLCENRTSVWYWDIGTSTCKPLFLEHLARFGG